MACLHQCGQKNLADEELCADSSRQTTSRSCGSHKQTLREGLGASSLNLQNDAGLVVLATTLAGGETTQNHSGGFNVLSAQCFRACVLMFFFFPEALPKVKQKLETFGTDLPQEYTEARKIYGICGVSTTEAILMALHTHDRLAPKEKRQQMQLSWDQILKDSQVFGVDIKAAILPVIREQTVKYLLNN